MKVTMRTTHESQTIRKTQISLPISCERATPNHPCRPRHLQKISTPVLRPNKTSTPKGKQRRGRLTTMTNLTLPRRQRLRQRIRQPTTRIPSPSTTRSTTRWRRRRSRLETGHHGLRAVAFLLARDALEAGALLDVREQAAAAGDWGCWERGNVVGMWGCGSAGRHWRRWRAA